MRTIRGPLWREESGQTLLEYGMILLVVSTAAVAALVLFRTNLAALYAAIVGALP